MFIICDGIRVNQSGDVGASQIGTVVLGYDPALPAAGGLWFGLADPSARSTLNARFLAIDNAGDSSTSISCPKVTGGIAEVELLVLGTTSFVHGIYDDSTNTTKLGFFNAAPPVARPTVTGALSAVADPAAKAVLTSIVSQLAALGLVINGTT